MAYIVLLCSPGPSRRCIVQLFDTAWAHIRLVSYSYLVPPHRSNLFQYKFWNIDFGKANSHCAENMVRSSISISSVFY